VQDVCNRTESRLIAVARSAHMEDVGFFFPMFSDRSEKYALRNFDSDTAREFAVRTAQEMHLNAANRDGDPELRKNSRPRHAEFVTYFDTPHRYTLRPPELY
jgi:hypothetical protein